MDAQKREHFRINYPLAQPAKLELKQGSFPIIDISERGIKFGLTKDTPLVTWKKQMPIKGSINFLIGDRCVVEGQVLRFTSEYVVIILNQPILLKTIYDEHRFLIQKFGVDKEKK